MIEYHCDICTRKIEGRSRPVIAIGTIGRHGLNYNWKNDICVICRKEIEGFIQLMKTAAEDNVKKEVGGIV